MTIGKKTTEKSDCNQWLPGRLAAAMVAAMVATGDGGRFAEAAPPVVQMPGDETLQPGAASTGPLDFLTALPRSNYVLGDMWGLRTVLSQLRHLARDPGNQRSTGQRHRRRARGADYDGSDPGHSATRHQPRLRLAWRPVQRQRAANPRPQPERRQSADAADRERDRGGPFNPAVGALVPAEIPGRRPARHQNRPAEPRPGIHGQPERQLFRQHDVRLADGALGRSARRRTGLSAVGAGRSVARAADRSGHRSWWASSTAARCATTTAIRRCAIRPAPAFR